MSGKSHIPGSVRTSHAGSSLDRILQSSPSATMAERVVPSTLPEDAEETVSAGAFGYLRGHRDRAFCLEFRFRTGNREWFSYGLLASCRYNPSVGILLRFTADLVTLVLSRGSNLDLPVHHGAVDLIGGGWVVTALRLPGG